MTNRILRSTSAVIAILAVASSGTRASATDLTAPKELYLPAGQETVATERPARINNAWEKTALRLKGLDGAWHSLENWRGKVIMLNFWASWCAPCQYEIPEFVRYQSRYAERGLQIIGIGVDEERKLRKVKRSLGINYPVLVLSPARGPELMAKWGNPSGILPYSVVIAGDGQLQHFHLGQMEQSDFDRHVLPLLGED